MSIEDKIDMCIALAKKRRNENDQLREQNRVLREALEQAALTICSEFCGSEHHHRECEIVQAALTATSQLKESK